MRPAWIVLLPLLLLPLSVVAGERAGGGASPPPKRIRAQRIETPPEIDGRLDEAVWAEASFRDDFVQKEPDEGAPPTERTEVAVLYDADALYVGARLHARDPSAIRALLTRRDTTTGAERFIVSLDTYLNHRTAYSFAVTAAGVRAEWLHPQDNEWNRDATFDPVWEAGAKITEWGWSCEMRIPFSQLRFNTGTSIAFGVNFNRYSPQTNEDVFWIAVPKQAQGWASYFGLLEGIEQVHAGHHVELLPYAAGEVTQTSATLLDPDDPFARALSPAGRVGLDAKIGLGTNLTLDATLNPDFGQVEADPAVVNLSAFETFYEEKRPFFLEGKDLFAAKEGPNYFYSRRIGAAPTGQASTPFADVPRATPILGAAKITGRSEAGLSTGILLATTGQVRARTFDPPTGTYGRKRVEPLAGFGVLRLQQQVLDNDSTLGLTLTGVQRDLADGDPLSSTLPDRALAAGTDLALRLGEGTYQLTAYAGGSTVHGSERALQALQRSSAHYYQRPDQGHVTVDPHRRTLSGFAAGAGLEKVEGEHWLWEMRLEGTSPGFEINDVGFMQRADTVRAEASLTRRETRPRGAIHRWSVTANTRSSWNFGGVFTGAGAGLFANLTLRSYWTFVTFADVWPASTSDRATRGGPLLYQRGGFNLGGGVVSSRTHKHSGRLFAYGGRTGDGGLWYGADGVYRAEIGSRVEISFRPSVNVSRSAWQYVAELPDGPVATFGRRFVFAQGTVTTVQLPLRLNVGLTPDLSLEVYAELFSSGGHFDTYGDLLDGRDGATRWHHDGDGSLARAGGLVSVRDERGGYVVPDTDYHYSSLRTNLVLRWEWLPGSTLYLVWQQDRAFVSATPLPVPRGLGEGLVAPGEQLLALKVAYWYGL